MSDDDLSIISENNASIAELENEDTTVNDNNPFFENSPPVDTYIIQGIFY